MNNGTHPITGSTLPPPLTTATDMRPHWDDVELSFDQAADRIVAAHAADGQAADLPITVIQTWAVAPKDGRFALVPLARHHEPRALRANAFSNLMTRLDAPAEFIRDRLPAPLQLATCNWLLGMSEGSSAATLRLREACEVVSFEVVRHEILENEVIVVGRLSADGIINVDFGTAAITLDAEGRAVSVGDDLKAASSDCIKRCARLLGCPLDLAAHADRNGNGRPRERAAAPDDRVTARQLAAIQAACRRRSIGREELHALVAKKTGKGSVALLTKAEASSVIDELGTANGVGAH